MKLCLRLTLWYCLSVPCVAAAQDRTAANLAAGGSAASSASQPSTPAERDFDALLLQVRDTLLQAKSYTVDIQCDWTSKGAGHETSGKHFVHLAVVNPDKLRLEISSDVAPDAKYVLITDGKSIYRAFTAQGLYSLTSTKAPRQDIEADGLTLSSLQASGVEFLLRQDAYGAIASQVVRVDDAGVSAIAGQTCRVFEVLLASKLKAIASISDGPHPLPIQHTTEKVVLTADGGAYDYRATTRLDWKLNAPIEPETFDIQPPANGRRIPDFNAYFRAGLSQVAIGGNVPDLTWDTLGQRPFALQGQRGKSVVVLYFWATWAAPSVEAIGELKKFTDHYSQRGVTFVTINVGEAVDDVRAFVEKLHFEGLVALDPRGETLAALAIDSIPATAIIDQEGKLRAVHKGLGVRDRVGADLEAILKRSTANRK